MKTPSTDKIEYGIIGRIKIHGKRCRIVVVSDYPIDNDGEHVKCLLDRDRRRIEVSEHVRLWELPAILANIDGVERQPVPRPAFGPVAEALPVHDRSALATEFRRAIGAAYGRPHYGMWKMADAYELWIRNSGTSEKCGPPILVVCRFCGHELQDEIAMGRHLSKKHGWTEAPGK